MIKHWTKVENGVVMQVILADDMVIKAYSGEWIEMDPKVTYAGIGWAYDGVKFLSPPPYEAKWDGKAWQPTESAQLKALKALIETQTVDLTKVLSASKTGVIETATIDVLVQIGAIDAKAWDSLNTEVVK